MYCMSVLPPFPSTLQHRLSFDLLNNQPALDSHGEVADSLQYFFICPTLVT
jgi:hypothetical protein